MLSVGRPKPSKSKKAAAAAAGYYFRYYTDKEKEQGIWFGRGAELLGLSGPVLESEFRNLVEGYSPDGKSKLVQNAGAQDRQRFWDLVFSPAKSISLLYLLGPKEVQPEILSCVENALFSTLVSVEDAFGLSRVGKAGETIVEADLAFAIYRHISSRADEPQVHFHCVVPNVGVRSDGSTGAILSKPIFRAKIAIGEHFQKELAREFSEHLGIELEKGRVGYEVREISRELCDVFSTRRKEIEAELARIGHSDAMHSRGAAEKTRARKSGARESHLLPKWKDVAAAHGFTEEHARKIIERGRENLRRRQSIDFGRGEETQARVSARIARDSAKEFQTAKQPEQSRESSHSKRKSPARVVEEDPEHAKRVKEFQQRLREITDRIFPERQTSERIGKIAHALGRKMGIEKTTILASVRQLKLPVHRRFTRTEWRKAFRKAPKWSPVSELRTARLVLKDQPRRWAAIRWEMAIPRIGESSKAVRIQERKLFPKAPQWSPLSKLSLPALRFSRPRAKLEEKQVAPKVNERERSR
jgi:conjugative relaxase-like TrwC/TraI family protein